MACLKLRRLSAHAIEPGTPRGERGDTLHDARRSEEEMEEFFTECWHTQALATRAGTMEASIGLYGGAYEEAWPWPDDAHSVAPTILVPESGVYGMRRPAAARKHRGSQQLLGSEGVIESPL